MVPYQSCAPPLIRASPKPPAGPNPPGVPAVPAGSGAPLVKVGPHSPGSTRFTKNEKVRLLCTTPIQFQRNENESVALA